MNTNDSNEGQGSSHAFDVYNELGYGFMELLYARALEITMQRRGLRVDREYPVAVTFKGERIGFHRIDMLIERRVIVEIKSTERLAGSCRRQLRNCVKALGVDLGILLHFGPAPKFHRELRRGLDAPAST